MERRLEALAAEGARRADVRADVDARLAPLVEAQRALGAGACSRAELAAVADEAERRLGALEERLTVALEAKAGIREVAAELEGKASVADVNALLDTKATIADVNESLLLKANKGAVVAALGTKASHAELEAAVQLSLIHI